MTDQEKKELIWRVTTLIGKSVITEANRLTCRKTFVRLPGLDACRREYDGLMSIPGPSVEVYGNNRMIGWWSVGPSPGWAGEWFPGSIQEELTILRQHMVLEDLAAI